MLVSNGGHDADHSRSGVCLTSIGLTSKSRCQSESGLFSPTEVEPFRLIYGELRDKIDV
jgi:hypothetical protein